MISITSRFFTIFLLALALTSGAACVHESEPIDYIGDQSQAATRSLSGPQRGVLELIDDELDRRRLAQAFMAGHADVDNGMVIPTETASSECREFIDWLNEVWLSFFGTCDDQARACLDCNGGGATTSIRCPEPRCKCPENCEEGICAGLEGGAVVTLDPLEEL